MDNKRIAIIATIAPLLMFGAAFAGVPLYKIFCEKTGYGGTTKKVATNQSTASTQMVEVSFDTNVMPNIPLEFKAKQKSIKVHLGENNLAFFTIKNTSNRPVAAIAEFNVTPDKAAKYFNKLQCFCFTQQNLAANQEIEVPVLFYVDKDLNENEHTKEVKDLTLSYTFMQAKKSASNENEQPKL